MYSLRPSEIQTLTDVGRFRVVAVEDLANLGYAGDRSRMDSDLRNLVQQGLLQRRGTSALKKESQHVLTLTKQGQGSLRRQGLVPEDQTKRGFCLFLATAFGTLHIRFAHLLGRQGRRPRLRS